MSLAVATGNILLSTMSNPFCVLFIGLCFIVSVAFLIYQDPSKNLQPVSVKSGREVPELNNQSRSSNCLKNRFSDILLVVIYNHPLYDSADLLREFYSPVFPNLYFCGEIENSTYRIHSSPIHRGIYGYKCLADAIEKHKGFAGYLYINDDVIVNYWNLLKFRFNFSKIGESTNQFGRVSIKEPIPNNWYWWISPYGFNNCKNAIDEIKLLATNFNNFRRFFGHYRNNGDDEEYCNNGRSDIVYIPGQLALDFYEISNIFYKHRVFLEIAIPTVLRLMATKEDISTLHGLYLPGDVRKKDPRVVDSRYFWSAYFSRPSIWFIHPFKLHHYEDHNRDLNIELLKRNLIRRSVELTKC